MFLVWVWFRVVSAPVPPPPPRRAPRGGGRARAGGAGGAPPPPAGAGRRGYGDRYRKRLLPADRRALEGVPPARRPGAGDPASPRSAGARRADRGARPEPARRDPPVDRSPRERPHRHPLDPRALRGATDLLAPADHQPGQDRGRWSGGPADRPGGGSGRNLRGGVRGGSRGGAREAAGGSSRHARIGPGRRPCRGHPDPRRRAGPPTRDLRARARPPLDAVRAAPAGRHPRGPVPAAHAGGSLTMQATWTIARRELKALFDQPTAYILLVVFIAVNGFLCFRQLDLYGVASLRPMFDFLPWVLLFLVPAVTMRALAEDARSGTLEVVLAQPINELELLLGKYVGQVLFLWLALAITLTIPLGLALGTGPQVGILIAQYVGAALLLLGLAGVGVWASSVTRNQITAFILAVAVMFALILVGLDPLVVGLPPQLGAIAASLGVLSHFSSIARGVIDLRDAVYFVSLAVLFLVFAYFALLSRKMTPQGEALKRLRLGTALLAVAVIVVNLLRIDGRIDLTPGNSFTLSPATRQLLGTLPDLVTVRLFASAALPPEVSFLKRDVDDLLSDYRAAGHGKVKLIIADPATDSAALREARSLGIPPVQFNVLGQSELQVKEGYLGIAVRYGDGVKTIPFVQQTNDLEYRLTSDIRELTHPEKAVIAFGEITDARGQRGFQAF